MLRNVVLSTAVFVLAADAAGAQQVQAGAGSQSCGQWVEARRAKSTENTVRSSILISWVQGYLVGVAEATADERTVEDLAHQLVDGKISPDLSVEQQWAFRQKKFGTLTGWVFDPPDSDAISVWMDKYCSANPLDVVKKAAGELANKLEGLDSAATHPKHK